MRRSLHSQFGAVLEVRLAKEGARRYILVAVHSYYLSVALVIVNIVNDIIRCAFDVTFALLHVTFELFLFTFALHMLIVGQIASLLLHLPGRLVELPYQRILVTFVPKSSYWSSFSSFRRS